jgi:ribonuclease P protein component
VLPAGSRLRRSTDFAAVLRRGSGSVRSPRRTLVATLWVPTTDDALVATTVPAPAQAGFIVSRVVGPAVVRNRVRRRLRHLVRARLEALPSGGRLVVRALPPAATASSAVLGHDLDSALVGALRRAGVSSP